MVDRWWWTQEKTTWAVEDTPFPEKQETLAKGGFWVGEKQYTHAHTDAHMHTH